MTDDQHRMAMMMADPVYRRWCARFPDAPSRDEPRDGGGICDGPLCEGQGFAWYGYDGLCGECYEGPQRPTLRLVEGGAR